MTEPNHAKKWPRFATVQIGKHDPHMVGVVKRRASDGSWVDVFWLQTGDYGDTGWTKRHYDPSKLRPASSAQRQLLSLWLALQEALERGWLERVSSMTDLSGRRSASWLGGTQCQP
jgi:hypothetical protein